MVDRSQEGSSSKDDDDLDDDEEAGPSKPMITTFELNETLYAEAELEDTDTVYLWLGVSWCHLCFNTPLPIHLHCPYS